MRSPRDEAGARRRALAREVNAQRQVLRAQVRSEIARHRRARPVKREGRRRRWLLLLLALLLLLLLRRCSCNDPPAVQAVAPAPAPAAPAGLAAEAVPVPPPVERIARRDRPHYTIEAPEPLAWLAPFRLQVASRSPRLAACFVGVQLPGRLKWTAAVSPTSGRVSEPTLEPMLLGATLTRQQRDCVLDVLADPPYRLDAVDERSTPTRIGLVIEF